jgi:hypothetical protein
MSEFEHIADLNIRQFILTGRRERVHDPANELW